MEKLSIHTERLFIRNLLHRDIDNFHAYRSDPGVTLYQGFDTIDKHEATVFIEEQAEKLFGKPGEWVQYGIEEMATHTLIGDCAIKLDENDPRNAEIGITINPAHQNKGMAREAILGIMSYLFDQKNIHRISETVDVENVNSIKLLESLKFRKEGHFIENIYFNNKWGSEYQYAMLQREWRDEHTNLHVVK